VISEEERKSQGLHDVVIAISTASFRQACIQDLWLRLVIGLFAGVSVAGLAFAWRNTQKSSDLQMRLLRASELNSHLRQMNLAAAGLAHETRNPLNIIRGLAQMISKDAGTSQEIRKKTSEITDEVDRVTAQLNEFIDYSRPRDIRRAPVALNAVVADVARALQSDLEDKSIRLTRTEEHLTVEADEQFFRQVLFNLLLNAVQAVDKNGEIQIVARKANPSEACLEVRDNGPGVPLEQRNEIFKPYFTTHQKGTGLGLAVVQQIVLAHGWEIECASNDSQGALFRVSRMQLAAKA
jgi:signal transduction histidine kinase